MGLRSKRWNFTCIVQVVESLPFEFSGVFGTTYAGTDRWMMPMGSLINVQLTLLCCFSLMLSTIHKCCRGDTVGVVIEVILFFSLTRKIATSACGACLFTHPDQSSLKSIKYRYHYFNTACEIFFIALYKYKIDSQYLAYVFTCFLWKL